MSAIDAPDWQRDLPFLGLAFVVHGLILASNPCLLVGGKLRPLDAPIPVEFVTELPKPPEVTPQLAVVAGGDGKDEKPKGYGPGEHQSEQIKKGLPDADPKAAPKPKVRRLSPAERARLAQLKAEREERRQVARAAALQKAEEARALRAEARRLAAERAAVRAEAARAAREEKVRRAAELAAARAEAARQRAFQLAQAKAERARRTVELERQLASLPNPDEELSAATASRAGGARRGAGAAFGSGAAADPAGAEAALESDLRDSVGPAGGRRDGGGGLAGALAYGDAGDPGYSADGRGGADDANRRPAGGGFEDGGGGPVAWSVEGPVGNRRVLKRVLPHCPDWVSQRGLELTVQLKFQVLDDGTIKRSIVIKRTSGFPDIDRLAVEALRRWKFQPLHSGVGLSDPDVWGVISFKFLMG